MPQAQVLGAAASDTAPLTTRYAAGGHCSVRWSILRHSTSR